MLSLHFLQPQDKKGPNQNKRPHSWIFLPRLFLRSSLPPNRKAYWWKHNFYFVGYYGSIFLLLLLQVFTYYFLSLTAFQKIKLVNHPFGLEELKE